jgi:predicted DCC family thiol-disulfide oxidoreductase YuxK
MSTVAYAEKWGDDEFQCWLKSEAILRAMAHCYFPFSLISYSRFFIPLLIRDFLYGKVAIWRYAIFGRISDGK